MFPLTSKRSRESSDLRPRRWLALPLLAFAAGVIIAGARITATDGAGPSGYSPERTAEIEREAAAAVARLADPACGATYRRWAEYLDARWERRAREQQRAVEARDPATVVRQELARIDRGFDVPACAPTLFDLMIGAADVEEAVDRLATAVRTRPPAGAERVALLAALDRPRPVVDVGAVLDRARDLALIYVASALRVPMLREQALDQGYAALRQHARGRELYRADRPLIASARALEHDRGVSPSVPLALRLTLDAHAMLGELRDELLAAR